MPDWIQIETHGGTPISFQGNTITPFVNTVQVRLPVGNLGLIWNRPVSILAVDQDGNESIIRVPDVTRQVQWSLLGAAAVSGLFYWMLSRRKR